MLTTKRLFYFWLHVNKHGPIHPKLRTRCWLWTGATNYKGYGVFAVDRVSELAHRVSWFIECGRWPTPCGLHKCDNPPCVRPSHLFEGTQADNLQDAIAKGRAVNGFKTLDIHHPTGEAHYASILTEAKVIAIRERHAAGGVTYAQLAKIYKVHKTHVGDIVRLKKWKHI